MRSMNGSWIVIVALAAGLAACGNKNDLTGSWKAVATNMDFAGDAVPKEARDELAKAMQANAPSFELSSDGKAKLRGGEETCDGTWSREGEVVHLKCGNADLQLEKKGDQLISMPDRMFTFERQ